MINIFKKQMGMTIIGQGGKIILFTLPSLIAAILVHKYFPQFVALPESISFIRTVGYILLVPGLILWGAAVIQLMTGFSKGKLVTTGAYGVVRNPIYSSVTFFILPSVALITSTWVYFIPSIFLYAGVMIFIGNEEKQLTNAFGKEYEEYLVRVDRLVPFKNPDLRYVLSHAKTGQQELKMARIVLLICGILASLVWMSTDILAALRYEGYNYPLDPISGLSAIGAPTRPFVTLLDNIYIVLKITFAVGVWMTAGQKRAVRITAGLLFAWGVIDLAASFFPYQPGEPLGTLGNMMHAILAGGITVVLILLTIGVGASVDGKAFRFFSYGTLLVMLIMGVLPLLGGFQIAADQPPEWFGAGERINAYGFMLWMMILTIILLRTQPKSLSREDREKIVHPDVATNRV